MMTINLCWSETKWPAIDLARIRTWNLLLRRQTRYPLRHKTMGFQCRIFATGLDTNNNVHEFNVNCAMSYSCAMKWE